MNDICRFGEMLSFKILRVCIFQACQLDFLSFLSHDTMSLCLMLSGTKIRLDLAPGFGARCSPPHDLVLDQRPHPQLVRPSFPTSATKWNKPSGMESELTLCLFETESEE